MTKSEKIIKVLTEKIGCVEVFCRSKKYTAFQHPIKGTFFFVGKAGALRGCLTNTPSKSHSLSFLLDRHPYFKEALK